MLTKESITFKDVIEYIENYDINHPDFTEENIKEYLEFFNTWGINELWGMSIYRYMPELQRYVLCMNMNLYIHFLSILNQKLHGELLGWFTIFISQHSSMMMNIQDTQEFNMQEMLGYLIGFDRFREYQIEKEFNKYV